MRIGQRTGYEVDGGAVPPAITPCGASEEDGGASKQSISFYEVLDSDLGCTTPYDRSDR